MRNVRTSLKRIKTLPSTALWTGMTILLTAAPAYADTQWDSGISNLTTFLSGSVVKWVALIAVFIGGMALIFGEDLGTFGKRLMTIAIAAGIIVMGASFVTQYLGTPQ
jgi:type IV secretory pathway VirB2 component (pilin)